MNPYERWTRALLAMVILLSLLIPLADVALADGPLISITEPLDGGVSQTSSITVRGCCTAPVQSLDLGPSELGIQPGSNMQWRSGSLVMRPVKYFSDDFSGVSLDPARWVKVRDTGILTVVGGELTMAWESYTSNTGLIRSIRGITPDNMDWRAEYRLKNGYLGYNGAGGGLSGGVMDPMSSDMATWGTWVWTGGPDWWVYSHGSAFFNGSSDGAYHTYALSYSAARRQCELLMDGDSLGVVSMTSIPEIYWFGATDAGMYYSSSVIVDYADVWTEGGSWTSLIYDLGHLTSIDDVRAVWTSTHTSSAVIHVEARTSMDNITWTAWAPMGEGGPALAGRYLQLRTFVSLPGVKSEQASISITKFKVSYHDPLTSVEVRASGGKWTAVTGLEAWSADLTLEEDENTIAVRANDTAGRSSTTSITVVVDTTPPVGSVRILGDQQYHNDLDVILELNATDRYGVAYVQVSNAPDMFNKQTFYYCSTVSWRLDGLDGEVPVFVRFVDAHGLLSGIVTDSIIYDAVPPMGTVSIAGGMEYTPSTTVRLDLEYSDTRGVAKVELSNAPDFPPTSTVTVTGKVVEPWELLSDGDGPRSVHMRLTDLAGNVKVVSDTIEVYAPKRIGLVVIEEGAPYTAKTIVNLRIDCPPEVRPQRMQLSADGTFTTEWENYQREKLWILGSGDGNKTVWVRFEDFRGIYSLPVNDTIVLDTVAPVVTVSIEGGAEYATRTNLTVSVVCEDASPPGGMWLAEDGRFDLVEPRPFASPLDWTVAAWEGRHYLYIQVEDGAGNLGSGVDSIYYAMKVPVLRLTLLAGASSNGRSPLEVEAQATDDYGSFEVQLAFGADPPGDAPWLATDGSQPLLVTVPPGTAEGNHEVRGRCRSAAGLVSQVAVVPVIIDLVAPEVRIRVPVDGAVIRQSGFAIMVEFTAQDPSGMKALTFSLDGGNWTTIPVADRTVEVVLGGTGEHTIAIRGLDKAGNDATATTTFRLERKAAVVVGGSGVLLLLIAAIIGVGVVGAIAYRRRRPSGPKAPAQRPTPAPAPAPIGAPPTAPAAPSEDGPAWEEF